MSYDFDKLPNKELLEILGTMTDPKSALIKVFKVASERKPLSIFSMERPELMNDVEEVASMLENIISEKSRVNGLFIGIDTLNMDDGRGFNVEIYTSNEADIAGSSIEWIYQCDRDKKIVLLNGLYNASLIFNQYESDDDRWFAEYVVFLAYSGIVIGSALQKALIRTPFISIWGFHDGDMYKIAKGDGNSVVLNPFPSNSSIQ